MFLFGGPSAGGMRQMANDTIELPAVTVTPDAAQSTPPTAWPRSCYFDQITREPYLQGAVVKVLGMLQSTAAAVAQNEVALGAVVADPGYLPVHRAYERRAGDLVVAQ
jgi:hypothetical protein